MIDAGTIEPSAALGPSRNAATGETVLGRLTTTEEQRLEVIRKLSEKIAATPNRGFDVKAEVQWPNADPTIITVTFSKEHIEGSPVFLPAKIEETTIAGARIIPSEEARLRTLHSELVDLHERGML